ncbi:hypothetical protein NC652_022471 [Populus alba x Populus x berolinensis]|nr:hypothetical protein NC652_022471 [Populus alba x Populus x berolinensis]
MHFASCDVGFLSRSNCDISHSALAFATLPVMLLECYQWNSFRSIFNHFSLVVPTLTFDESNFSLWGSGEWWMLLVAQSMAVGMVMVRWVSRYSDPVMATG